MEYQIWALYLVQKLNTELSKSEIISKTTWSIIIFKLFCMCSFWATSNHSDEASSKSERGHLGTLQEVGWFDTEWPIDFLLVPVHHLILSLVS